jgi:hypothetical protein
MPGPDLNLTSNQEHQRDYSNPTKKCDMVMKGGITSGVVYPLAVCELAQTYTFKNIGGTSAGAIAAAAASAAEYGRQHERPDKNKHNFAELEKLPQWLGAKSPDGKNSNLFALFQPQASTKRLFNTLIAGLAGGKALRLLRRPRLIIRVLLTSIWNFPLGAILGLLIFLLLFIVPMRPESGLLLIQSLISALLITAVVALSGTFYSFYRCAGRTIPQNYYGLCTGMPSPSPWFIRWLKWLASKGVLSTWLNRVINRHRVAPSLTSWLTEYLDRLAGVEDRDKQPLTFGDLWGQGDERNINLEMLTTNLTLGRPYRLPFDTEDFFFDPKEFEKFFPERVVNWMKEKSAKMKDEPSKNTLFPLPKAADLPVVVATRLSLSFPILLSAIPLYAVDYTRTSKKYRNSAGFLMVASLATCLSISLISHYLVGQHSRLIYYNLTLIIRSHKMTSAKTFGRQPKIAAALKNLGPESMRKREPVTY